MGHGGSGHKRAERQLQLGQHFAKVSQIAAVAIDGPFHGDRVATPLEPLQYQEMISAMGVDKVTDGMINDWFATLDALNQLGTIDADRVAYIGFSMGTRFGLPYVAAAGNRLRCAVLGKNGMSAPIAMNMALRFTEDAPKITVPVLFHVQWDDELFPRDGQFELFDLIGTHDKQLIAFPGHIALQHQQGSKHGVISLRATLPDKHSYPPFLTTISNTSNSLDDHISPNEHQYADLPPRIPGPKSASCFPPFSSPTVG